MNGFENKINKINNDKKKHTDVYVIIEKTPISLPSEAKYVFQCDKGYWFFSRRSPRIKNGEWTPTKRPVQMHNPNGALTTTILKTAPVEKWQETIKETMRKVNLKHIRK